MDRSRGSGGGGGGSHSDPRTSLSNVSGGRRTYGSLWCAAGSCNSLAFDGSAGRAQKCEAFFQLRLASTLV